VVQWPFWQAGLTADKWLCEFAVHRLSTLGRILKGEKPACGSQVRPSARFAVSALIEKGPRVRRAGSMGVIGEMFQMTFHSITSLARASTVGRTSRPSAFAVLRLITSSYLVGA
jgi:hypothetical protein